MQCCILHTPNAFVCTLWWQCCRPVYATLISSAARGTTLVPAHWLLAPKSLATRSFVELILRKSRCVNLKCKEARWPSYFCLSWEWHPLQALHLAKLSFYFFPPWQTIHPPKILSTLLLMLIMNSHYLVNCHFFASSCLENSYAPIHEVHKIPYSQRDTSWVGNVFWMLSRAYYGV